MNIVLLGIQGSGKGSLVERLKSELDFTLISTGDLLRQEVKSGSELGLKIMELINQGLLVDDEIIIDIIKKRLKNAKDIVVFDGFPRNLVQAKMFEQEFGANLVINLNLSRQVAMERILNRLTCANCGYITKKSEVTSCECPVCGGELQQRADDTPKSIEVRFNSFEKQTSPLVEFYKDKGVLHDIDASASPMKVFEEALKVIKNECNN